jgi:environmental stress-induced protein Ves
VTVQRFRAAELVTSPWRNGGGATKEIVSMPPGADFEHLQWRVSLATIAADGPFSTFPGIDRTILLLDGDGVLLDVGSVSGATTHRLVEPLVPFDFPGDAPVNCRLTGGTSTVVNLMVRSDRGSGQVAVLRAESTVAADAGLLLATGDAEVVHDGSRHLLQEGTGVWWDEPTSLQVRFPGRESGSAVVAMAWSRRGELGEADHPG